MKLPSAKKLLCSAFALYGLGMAQHNMSFESQNFGNGEGFGPSATGPWGTKLSEFQSEFFDILSQATTLLRINGPNVSYAYPRNPNPLDPWSLSVNVRADIPAANLTGNISAADRSKFFTGSIVQLRVPTMIANLSNEPVTPPPASSEFTDWDFCVFMWDFTSIDNVPYPDKFREDDGNCTSIVSEQCVKDMKTAAVDLYKSHSRTCQCPDVSRISTCDQASLFAKLGCAAKQYNATDIKQWYFGTYPLITYAGPFHDKGNATAYNETGSLTWPVMTLWGNWPTKTYEGNNSDTALEVDNTAELTCMRPMKAPIGTGKTPGIPGGRSATSHVTVGFGWLMVGLLLALCN